MSAEEENELLTKKGPDTHPASVLEKKWKWVLAVAIIVSAFWLTLAAVLDYNRYHGYCAKREFNDSLGPLAHDGDRIICRVENDSARPLPPGKLPGQIFEKFERSRPTWILFGVHGCIVIALNVILIIVSLPKKKETISFAGPSRAFDHHLVEHGRVSRIIYACTAFIIVYQSIVLAKIIDCRPDSGAELFYTVVLAADVLVQGTFVIMEVSIRRYRGSSPSKVCKIALVFISAENFIMWGHSIVNAVCRNEEDNAAIVGKQMWSFLDPVFGSAVAFFRILSGCLYLLLAIPTNDDPHDPDSGEHYAQSPSNTKGVTDDKVRVKSRGVLEFMMNSVRVSEQTLKVCHIRDRGSTYFYYSALYERKQRSYIRSIFGLLLAIPFVAIPVVAYDGLARHAGIEQNTRLKYTVEIATNCLLILLCSGFLIYHGLLELLKSTKCTKCGKLQFGKSKCQACKICDHCANCANCRRCKSCCKCTRRSKLIKLVVEVERNVFCIFTLFAIVFNVMLAAVETGGDLVADIFGIFSVILHALFILFTTFLRQRLHLIWRGNRRHTVTAMSLYVLFALTLGSLIIDIEREHLDEDVHEKLHLRVVAPLLVDFRVHAAILTFSILNNFLKQHTVIRELEDNEIFEQVVCNEESLHCFMPDCRRGNGALGGSLEVPTNEVFWKCKGQNCKPACYCSNCFVNFIAKVGFCPTCGDPSTGKPQLEPFEIINIRTVTPEHNDDGQEDEDTI